MNENRGIYIAFCSGLYASNEKEYIKQKKTTSPRKLSIFVYLHRPSCEQIIPFNFANSYVEINFSEAAKILLAIILEVLWGAAADEFGHDKKLE